MDAPTCDEKHVDTSRVQGIHWPMGFPEDVNSKPQCAATKSFLLSFD